MPPAKLVDPDDLQQILADALTSFSPLAALVGANSARALSNHTSNSKQLWATSLAPIGALGILSTVVKGSNLAALKDLLGAGEADIYDACAELGCGSLYGVCPRFSKRGGLTCHSKTRNPGVAACAILRGKWNLATKDAENPGKDQLDFNELSKFLTTIYMSTISGRLVWEVQDREALGDMLTRLQQHLLQSWHMHDEIWDNQNLLPSFQECSDPKLRDATASIELHWPAPSMPLETNATIVFLFIAAFTILPVAVGVIAAIPKLTGWQSPAASALLLGGQGILGLGHFLAQIILKRQRQSVYLEIPRQNLSDTWMLVDNVWFTSLLARRHLSLNPLSPKTVKIGQYIDMKPHLPKWEVLVTLVTIGIGFLAFYIGARSSHLWVILIEIGFFFVANLCKGYVISLANEAYVTPLNNPGFIDMVVSPDDAKAGNKGILSILFEFLSTFCVRKQHEDLETELRELNSSAKPTSYADEKAIANSAFETNDKGKGTVAPGPITLEPWELPLPPSTSSSIAGPSRPSSIKAKEPSLINFDAPAAPTSKMITDPLLAPEPSPSPPHTPGFYTQPREHVPTSTSPKPSQHDEIPGPLPSNPLLNTKYRLYAKVSARRHDAIGLFFFSTPQGWGTAAHIIYEACHDRILWAPHMKKEPFVVFPFGFLEKREEKTPKPAAGFYGRKNVPEEAAKEKKKEVENGKDKGKDKAVELHSQPHKQTYVDACLIMAMDETRNEDIFWATGQEFMTILVGAFTDSERLVTEYPESIDPNLFGMYVYFMTRLILLACTGPYASSPNPTPGWQVAAAGAGPIDRMEDSGMYPGVASMMRAIDLVRGKYAFDTSLHLVPMMRHHARNAVQSVFGA